MILLSRIILSTAELLQISRAFEVLSDSEKKKAYDTYGEAGLNGGGAIFD